MEKNQSPMHGDTMPNTQPNKAQQTPPYPQQPQGPTGQWYGGSNFGNQGYQPLG